MVWLVAIILCKYKGSYNYITHTIVVAAAC